MTRTAWGAVVAVCVLALAGCGSTTDTAATGSPSSASSSAPAGKAWTVDTSGWWVPSDPTGCLQETTTCPMTVWKSRLYKAGNEILNLMRHGDPITLVCKAPTPAPIRNSVKTESVYWYYSIYKGAYYWIPDIYVTRTPQQVTSMADGVPDCPSDTPGVSG